MAGFHADVNLENLILEIVDWGATSFVETGTGTGDSSDAIARARDIPVLTCEIDPERIAIAKKLMPSSVCLYEMDSREFIQLVIDDAGDLPLFYLDAHWYDDWPLLGELEAIGRYYDKAVIVIHDFKVPGRNDFSFAVGGGGGPETRTTIGGPANDLNYIMPTLKETGHEYEFFFPDYETQERTPGFVIIYQNVKPMGGLPCRNAGRLFWAILTDNG